jgi:membrane associated rhomboid family serine protease
LKSLLESESDGLELTRRHFYESIRFPFVAVLVLWLIHLHQNIDHWDPAQYGIMSRRIWGIPGVITGPMVHGSWQHLISNTFPFFVLSALSIYFYRKVAMRAFWMIYFMTGISVWLFARPVSHIGASGIVYGLVSFIFWNGVFRRSLRSIILALVVMLVYSGMFMGVLPDQEGISWESHLLGSIAGIFASFWFKGELEDEELEPDDPFVMETDEEKQYFIPRDSFEKTKTQRQAEAEEAARLREQQNYTIYPPYWHQSSTYDDPV